MSLTEQYHSRGFEVLTDKEKIKADQPTGIF